MTIVIDIKTGKVLTGSDVEDRAAEQESLKGATWAVFHALDVLEGRINRKSSESDKIRLVTNILKRVVP